MVDFVIRDDLDSSLIFRKRLAERLPAIAEQITDFELGLLHLEMGVLARATCLAIEQGAMGDVRAHIAFIDTLLSSADHNIENAICVSYLEDVFLGQSNDRYAAARAELSGRLEQAMAELEAHWEDVDKWLLAKQQAE